MERLLEEWSRVAPPLEAAPERLPEPLATIWLLDLTTHEHDVRGALDRPGARDAPAVLVALDFMVGRGLHGQVADRGLGPLEVRTPAGRWVVGAGSGQPVAAVAAPAFDLLRALTGRRSFAQIARFEWTGDPEPFLPAFQFGTFTTRGTDLDE